MRYINNKEISIVSYGKKTIAFIAYGSKVVWEAITSCFGSGGWDNNKGWNNDEGWNNGF